MSTQNQQQRLVFLGLLAALGAASAYAMVSVLGRIIGTQANPIVTITCISVIGVIFMIPIVRVQGLQGRSLSRPGLLWGFLTGIFSTTALASLLWALQYAPVVVVAPVVGTFPLCTLLLAHLFLRRLEQITFQILLGTLLIVGGVTAVAIASSGT